MTALNSHVRNLVPGTSERAMSDCDFEAPTHEFKTAVPVAAGPNDPRPEPGSGRVRRSYV